MKGTPRGNKELPPRSESSGGRKLQTLRGRLRAAQGKLNPRASAERSRAAPGGEGRGSS